MKKLLSSFLKKTEIKKFFSNCWVCHISNFLNNYKIRNYKKIQNQRFIFISCLKCNNVFYFWQNLITKKYFFVKKIHIVLYEPEIVGNVGSIIRLSAAFDLQLHLIEPFGFIFSEKWLKRSSTNHFKLANIKIYSDWNNFYQKNKDSYFVLTSSKSKLKLFNFDFRSIDKPIYLIFGCESKGLNDNLKIKYLNQTFSIYQTKLVSSINLANAVSIFVFFVLFQYKGLNLG